MDAPLDLADEVARLRGCLDDLRTVMALPELWPGREPRQIIDPLVDVLVGTLHLAFLFVRLSDTDGGQPIEIVRIGDSIEEWMREGISRAIAKLGKDGGSWPVAERLS